MRVDLGEKTSCIDLYMNVENKNTNINNSRVLLHLNPHLFINLNFKEQMMSKFRIDIRRPQVKITKRLESKFEKRQKKKILHQP
jgi:hypothetical protein